MSDIQNFDDRIRGLEYYVSLTTLEKDAASTKILDANGRDMGVCFSQDVPYSLACSSATEPSFFQKIIDEIKKAL